MKLIKSCIALSSMLIVAVGSATAEAPLFSDLGDHHREITTSSEWLSAFSTRD